MKKVQQKIDLEVLQFRNNTIITIGKWICDARDRDRNNIYLLRVNSNTRSSLTHLVPRAVGLLLAQSNEAARFDVDKDLRQSYGKNDL